MKKHHIKKFYQIKVNEQLKTIKYCKENLTKILVVLCLLDFEEGQDVIQLPCKHIFDPEGIKTWLKEEQAKCPICRFELD